MVGVQLTLLALAMSSAVNAVQNYCACTGNTAVTVKDFVMVGGAKTVVSSPDDCGAACTAFGPTCKFGGEMKSGEYSGYCWLWTFSSTGAQVTAKSDAENVWSYMVFKGTCTEFGLDDTACYTTNDAGAYGTSSMLIATASTSASTRAKRRLA